MQLYPTLTLFIFGGYPERFLNLCVQKGIYVSDASMGAEGLTLCIRTRQLKALRRILKQTGMRMRIIKRSGPAVFIQKHKNRKVFLLGFLFFLCAILFFSSFVWSVSVVGNKNLTENEIKSLLSSCDFHPGVVKYTVNIYDVKNAVLAKEPRLSWLWITYRGTRATVEVQERTLSPHTDADTPQDIVADKPGMIVRISALEGTPVVSVGDTVTQGQLLISRTMPTGRQTHADGVVLARTWHTLAHTASLAVPRFTPTGNMFSEYALLWHNRVFPLSFPKKQPTHAFSQASLRPLYLFSTLPLPLHLITLQKEEATIDTVSVDIPSAIAHTEALLINRLVAALPATDTYTSHSIKTELLPHHKLKVTLTAEVLANIAAPCP